MRRINALVVGTLSVFSVAYAQPRYSVRVVADDGNVAVYQTAFQDLLAATVQDNPNFKSFAAVWDNGKLDVRYGYYDNKGPVNTWGDAVNKFGDLVGRAEILRNSDYHAALWTREGQFIDLGTLGNGRDSNALDVSDDRWVVGYSTIYGAGSHPFVWHDGQMQDIGLLGYGPYSDAFAINERHQVVGIEAKQEGSPRAWIWDEVFGLRWITPAKSSAQDINDLGEVVGDTYIWKDGNVRNIGGDEAVAINNRSEVVGGRTSDYPYYWEPTYWDPRGKMYDINKLLLPGSGFRIDTAYDINDYGQIVALGIAKNGDYRFLLLTPIRPQVVP